MIHAYGMLVGKPEAKLNPSITNWCT